MLPSKQNFTSRGGRADFFTSFYLESCIWPDVIYPTSSIKFCADLGRSATEALAMIRHALA
jgi:hypothetical protein